MTQKQCLKCGESFDCDDRRKKHCANCKKTNAEKCRDRYQRTRATRIKKMREWYAANREAHIVRMREKWAQTRLNTPWAHILAGAKNRAKTAKVPFDLTHEWAKARWSGKCELSGIEFQLGLAPADLRMFAASVDRIEARKGYTQDNCRFILFAINAMRQNGTDEDVALISRSLAERMK